MRARGFTLIEVMVAMFILAVAGGAILLGLMLSLSQGKESQERVMAQILAGSVIDELKAHPYGSVEPLAGWTVSGTGYLREVNVAGVIDGIPSPVSFQLKATPVASNDPSQTQDKVQVSIAWTEPSGPASLQFTVPMESGWNRAASRGSQPPTVSSNWHDPAKYTIPSEPDYKTGGNDHTVNTDPPDAGDIVNNKTKAYQDLFNQLTQAKVKLDQDQQAVTADQKNVQQLQQQLNAAKSQKNPDQSTIDSLNAQLSAAQTQLTNDQAKVSDDQKTIADIQDQINQLDQSSS